ncbi:MAG TPA: dihydrofolate reductase family protein [Flavitalea sp.]|nr:dihydrofolate reductase family protein [Flavitalea sp.]
MRSVILGVAVSLDGYIEGPNGEYDWCFTDRDYGLSDFFKKIDAIFVGRKTFEMAENANKGKKRKDPFAHFDKYIFSNSLKVIPEGYHLMSGDIISKVREIKNREAKDIWLFGGSELTSSMINANLVDELWLSIHPVLLGGGKPLFHNLRSRKQLTLKHHHIYENGLIQTIYRFS